MVAALEKIKCVEGIGDIRMIISNQLLALARGEGSAINLDSMSNALKAMSESIKAEMKVAEFKLEYREAGAELGKLTKLGSLLIGNADK